MAEEDDAQKTEEPTPKKLQDAREKGEVVSSQEVKTWAMLMAAAGLLAGMGGYIGSHISMPFVGFLSNLHNIDADQTGALEPIMGAVQQVFYVLLIPFGTFLLVAIAANRMQHGGVFSFEKLKPDLKKISPMAGLKRMFSSRMPVEFLKIVAKLIAVGGVIVLIVYPERGRLDTMMLLSMMDILILIKVMVLKLLVGVIIVLTFIAVFDFSFQRYQHHKKLRMTKQEVKDEYKQTDGDPKVKGRLRSIRMERARQRMMANVPKADVVITNPTHYAVALEYKHGQMEVPRLIAKGVDGIAAKIREIAQENNIPIVENPPLARALHAAVELDEEIPPDHYKAVAEVISYVLKLRRVGIRPRTR
ncbi:MAG: flagellar biosynthesis protein FlhB [Alphaproteobacteria bacterium]|nr:MAG: flagellar biosynthesis protein FlhB [Alphaproteobacteria bacterium]